MRTASSSASSPWTSSLLTLVTPWTNVLQWSALVLAAFLTPRTLSSAPLSLLRKLRSWWLLVHQPLLLRPPSLLQPQHQPRQQPPRQQQKTSSCLPRWRQAKSPSPNHSQSLRQNLQASQSLKSNNLRVNLRVSLRVKASPSMGIPRLSQKLSQTRTRTLYPSLSLRQHLRLKKVKKPRKQLKEVISRPS